MGDCAVLGADRGSVKLCVETIVVERRLDIREPSVSVSSPAGRSTRPVNRRSHAASPALETPGLVGRAIIGVVAADSQLPVTTNGGRSRSRARAWCAALKRNDGVDGARGESVFLCRG